VDDPDEHPARQEEKSVQTIQATGEKTCARISRRTRATILLHAPLPAGAGTA